MKWMCLPKMALGSYWISTGRRAVKSKWVFKLKADGRYRARLVAKGFTQIPGIDFDETCSPVARFESMCMLLALAALEDWHIHSMDVKSAFLKGDLDEEIYMKQPQGFVVAGSEKLGFKWTIADAGIYVKSEQELLFMLMTSQFLGRL